MDRAKLEEAIANARLAAQQIDDCAIPKTWFVQAGSAERLRMLCRAAEHHLAALPKAKIVEVWRVESALGSRPCTTTHLDRESAEATAALLKQDALFSCIRVTGPHQHEVAQP